MSEPTGLRAARQGQIILRPVPGSPPLLPRVRVFRRNRQIRHIWAYAEASAREGLWPKPTTADAAAQVVLHIFDDARERISEMAPTMPILSS